MSGKQKKKKETMEELEKLRQQIKKLETGELKLKADDIPLSASGDFLEPVLDSLMTAIWVTDKDDVICYANQGFSTITGVPLRVFMGSSILDPSQKENLKHFLTHYRKAKKTLKNLYYEAVPITNKVAGKTYLTGWLIPKIRDGKYDGMIGTAEDVTEQEEAEEALLESEKKYKILVENSLEGIAIAKGEKIIFVNQALSNMLGYDMDEIKKLSIMDFVAPECKEETLKRIEKRRKGEEIPPRYECRAVRKDGKSLDALISTAEFTTEGEKYVQATLIDITERKNAERKLKESKKEYQLLFNNFGNPITVYGLQGKIIMINNDGAKNLGGKPQELIGKSVYELMPEMADIFRRRTEHIVSTGKGIDGEDCIDLPVGSLCFRSNLQPIYDEDGKICAIQTISYDVTRQKRTEERLNKSQERYRQLFEDARLGVLTCDAEGKIICANQSALRILGFEKLEDLLDKQIYEFYQDQSLKTRLLKELKEKGHIKGAKNKATRKDGSNFTVWGSFAAKKDSEGKILYIDVIFTDIDEELND